MSDTPELETLSKGPPLIEQVGEIPCPTEGCDGTGTQYRLLGKTTIDNVCPRCIAKAEAEQEEAERIEEVHTLLRRSGMTPLMERWTLASYPRDEAGQQALDEGLRWRQMYLDADPRTGLVPNLVIYGEVGGGKTGLAWALLRSLIEERQIPGEFLIFPDLLARMKESFDSHVPFDAYSTVGRVPLLVVDDVGAERPTAWAVSQLLTLVDRRYQRCLPTIYTTNYQPHELAKRLGRDDLTLGVRIVSRMTANAVQIRVVASDRREVRR